MPVDLEFDVAAEAIYTGVHGTGEQMIGTAATDLEGVSIQDSRLGRSPCAQLKWLEDNSIYNYEAFVSLNYAAGYQGITITLKSDGSLEKEIKFPITGGDDADPYRQIPINHRRMVNMLISHVSERLE